MLAVAHTMQFVEMQTNYSQPYCIYLLLVTNKPFGNTEDCLFILASQSAFNIYVFTDSQPSFLSEWFITCSRLYMVGTQNYIYYQKERISTLSPSPKTDATFNLVGFVTLVSFLTQSALGHVGTQSSKAFSTCLSLSMCLTSLD